MKKYKWKELFLLQTLCVLSLVMFIQFIEILSFTVFSQTIEIDFLSKLTINSFISMGINFVIIILIVLIINLMIYLADKYTKNNRFVKLMTKLINIESNNENCIIDSNDVNATNSNKKSDIIFYICSFMFGVIVTFIGCNIFK